MQAVRSGAATLYKYLIGLYVLAVIVQFFLAGAGVFGEKIGVKLEDQTSWDPHRAWGFVALGFGSILLLLVALVWWPAQKKWLGLTFVLALLTFIVQPILAGAGEDSRWVGAFHAVNALVILGLSGFLARMAWGGRMLSARTASVPAG